MVDGSCELIAKGWEEMTLTQPSPERGRGNIIVTQGGTRSSFVLGHYQVTPPGVLESVDG